MQQNNWIKKRKIKIRIFNKYKERNKKEIKNEKKLEEKKDNEEGQKKDLKIKTCL